MGTALPFPLPSPFAPSGFSFGIPPTPRPAQLGVTTSALQGSQDRLIDPATLDYVRDGRGGWVHTADHRTAVLIGLSVELNRSPYDPEDGTLIAERRAAGDLSSPEFIGAETVRVLEAFARAGILANPVVAIRDEAGAPLLDADGRTIVDTAWIDLASGSPINQTFTPYLPR